MKSSTQIQQDLSGIERKLAPLTTELDRLVAEFAAELPPDVKRWMEHEVARHVEQHSGKVMAQGPEFARAVKSDLEQLYSQLEQICIDAVGTPAGWPHNKIVDSQLQMPQRSNESFFSASFRNAINHLGSILHKHGLLDGQDGTAASWRRNHGSSFQYAYHSGFNDRDNETAAKYNSTKIEHDQLTSNLRSKFRELEQAKARELWDEA